MSLFRQNPVHTASQPLASPLATDICVTFFSLKNMYLSNPEYTHAYKCSYKAGPHNMCGSAGSERRPSPPFEPTLQQVASGGQLHPSLHPSAQDMWLQIQRHVMTKLLIELQLKLAPGHLVLVPNAHMDTFMPQHGVQSVTSTEVQQQNTARLQIRGPFFPITPLQVSLSTFT